MGPFGGEWGFRRLWQLPFGKSASNGRNGPAVAVVPPFTEVRSLIQSEIDRARRYDHPLSVVAAGLAEDGSPGGRPGAGDVPPPDAKAAPPGDRHRIGTAPVPPHQAFLFLGSFLQGISRNSDVVIYEPNLDVYHVFLPQSDAASARSAAARFEELFTSRTSLPLRTRTATFPEDGLTLDVVIERVSDRWLDSPRTVGGESEEGENGE